MTSPRMTVVEETRQRAKIINILALLFMHRSNKLFCKLLLIFQAFAFTHDYERSKQNYLIFVDRIDHESFDASTLI